MRGASAPPPEFSAMIDAALGQGPRSDRLERALELMREATQGRGERDGAFALLVADALLTDACEAALEDEDPASSLREVLSAVDSA